MPQRVLGIAAFALAVAVTYPVLASLFWLLCVLGGHNREEMFYGSIAAPVFAASAGLLWALTRQR
jgi:hypothetical protein